MRSFWTNRFWRKYPKISFYDIIIIFLCTYTKIWTFQGKGRYFNIPLKKMVFCSYLRNYEHIEQNNVVAPLFWIAHIYVNTNILTKKTICLDYFKKIVFCSYLRKHHDVEKNKRFLANILKNLPFFISTLISKFRGKLRFFRITLKKSLFAHMIENINIPRKNSVFWHNYFYCSYLGKGHYFKINLTKIVLCPYLRKHQHIEVKDVSWDHFE